MYNTYMNVNNIDPDRENLIAHKLHEARGYRTFAEMAELAGVTRSALQNWESRKRTIETDQLIQISIHASKAGETWLRDVCLTCLNIRHPEMQFCLVKNGKLVVA
jgi:hypothetical protein